MSLWTKRHTITEVFNDFYGTESIAFDGKIWIICDQVITKNALHDLESCQSRVFVFDPESEVFTEMNCTPNVFSTEVNFLVANETDLYMWRVKWDWDFVRGNDYSLYKLNKATLEWECIMTPSRRLGIRESVVIINQFMYVLERSDHDDTKVLITINLPEGKISKTEPLSLCSVNGFLTTHNNTLYLVTVTGRYRKVFEINNGELIEVAQWKPEFEKLSLRPVQCAVSNECIGKSHYANPWFDFQAFDFETLEWESEVTHPDWRKKTVDHTIDLKSMMKINGSIYILVFKREEGRIELYVLDLHPKLTSICLAEMANRLTEEKDAKKLEETKQQLPIPMRTKLDELLETKSEARKKETENQ